MDLSTFMDPSEYFKLGQLFRNKIVRKYTVMTEAQFNKGFNVRFKCALDPTTNKPIDKKFSKKDFTDLDSIKTIDSNPDMYQTPFDAAISYMTDAV